MTIFIINFHLNLPLGSYSVSFVLISKSKKIISALESYNLTTNINTVQVCRKFYTTELQGVKSWFSNGRSLDNQLQKHIER